MEIKKDRSRTRAGGQSISPVQCIPVPSLAGVVLPATFSNAGDFGNHSYSKLAQVSYGMGQFYVYSS